MATDAVEVCNDALLLLGAQPIGALGESTERARLCNQFYARARKETLRSHPWNFALVRTRLYAYTEPAATLTPGAGATTAGATGVTFTASAGVFVAADVGRRLWNKRGPGKATITGYTLGTSVTATIDEAFPGLAGLAAAAWRRYNAAPAWGLGHTIALPADYLRAVLQDPDLVEYPFKIEGATLVTDTVELPFIYVRDVTDTAAWDATFDRALARKLAAMLAYPVTGQVNTARDMDVLFQRALAEAKAADAMEETPSRFKDDVLILARRVGASTAERVPLPASQPW